MPNIQNTVLQSRVMSSPPVNGTIKPDDVDGDCDGIGVEEDGFKSFTWMKNLLLALLLCASVAVQVTCVSPIGKSDPETGEHEAIPAPSTASEVAGLV